MSVYERRRLLAGLLKIELEIAAVTNGCLIIYAPEADAYLAIPQSVFGIETDLEAQMLTDGTIVSPDIVLHAGADDVEEIFTDGVLAFANTSAKEGALEIEYAVGDALASTASGDRLKYLEGIANSILEITSTIAKRRAQARQGKVLAENESAATAVNTTAQARGGNVTIAEIGSNAVMNTTRYAVGENYIKMACNAAITTTVQYTVTENEAGGLTYAITADSYEEADGAYIIGGSNESE